MMGIMCELPLLGWILAKFGLGSAAVMRRYRRHAIVAILIAAAAITPTADALTLFLVALPIWLLYETTILVVAKTKKIG